jgi:hypothetical protein
MDVNTERKGKVERRSLQDADEGIARFIVRGGDGKVQLEAWDMERRGYVTRIAALEETTKKGSPAVEAYFLL